MSRLRVLTLQRKGTALSARGSGGPCPRETPIPERLAGSASLTSLVSVPAVFKGSDTGATYEEWSDLLPQSQGLLAGGFFGTGLVEDPGGAAGAAAPQSQ